MAACFSRTAPLSRLISKRPVYLTGFRGCKNREKCAKNRARMRKKQYPGKTLTLLALTINGLTRNILSINAAIAGEMIASLRAGSSGAAQGLARSKGTTSNLKTPRLSAHYWPRRKHPLAISMNFHSVLQAQSEIFPPLRAGISAYSGPAPYGMPGSVASWG